MSLTLTRQNATKNLYDPVSSLQRQNATRVFANRIEDDYPMEANRIEDRPGLTRQNATTSFYPGTLTRQNATRIFPGGKKRKSNKLRKTKKSRKTKKRRSSKSRRN